MRTRQAAKLEAAASSKGDVLNSNEKEEEDGSLPHLPDILTLSCESSGDINQSSSKPPQQQHHVSLGSSLDPGPESELYFSCDLDMEVEDSVLPPYTKSSRKPGIHNQEVKNCVISPDFEQKECAPPIKVSRYARKKMAKASQASSTGSKWFDMKAPHLTTQLKNDLKLLQMRNALDPSRHYKANDSKKLPRYFQVGRVVADSSDFYSSRIPRRQRKQTLVDELLATQDYHRKKYLELQEKFRSGSTRHKRIKFKRKFKKAA